MFWVNIAILPLLAACAGAQSTINPITPNSIQARAKPKSLHDVNSGRSGTNRRKSNRAPDWLRDKVLKQPELVAKCFTYTANLKDVKNVCKLWQMMARQLAVVRENKIVHIDFYRGFSDEGLEILKSYDYSGRKLLIIIHGEIDIPTCIIPNYKKWFYLVRNLPLVANECFVVQRVGPFMDKLTLHSDTPNNCIAAGVERRSQMNGFILPEALLRKFDIAVVYPDLRLFRSRRRLFNGPAEFNKKLFARFFGWKESAPIKVALIFSRQVKDDVDSSNTNGDMQRAREVTRWLKSLPERENMIVFDFFDPFPAENRDVIGIGKDLAVLLFGGKTMLVEYTALQSRGEREASSGFLEASKTHLEEWKADVIDKWPQPIQKIAFVIFEAGFYEAMKVFRDVFGDDVKVVMLPRFSDSRPFQLQSLFPSTIVIIGFPGT